MKSEKYWIVAKHTSNTGIRYMFVGPICETDVAVMALQCPAMTSDFKNLRYGKAHLHRISMAGSCENLSICKARRRDVVPLAKFKANLYIVAGYSRVPAFPA